jgi:hypothetical protein
MAKVYNLESNVETVPKVTNARTSNDLDDALLDRYARILHLSDVSSFSSPRFFLDFILIEKNSCKCCKIVCVENKSGSHSSFDNRNIIW